MDPIGDEKLKAKKKELLGSYQDMKFFYGVIFFWFF